MSIITLTVVIVCAICPARHIFTSDAIDRATTTKTSNMQELYVHIHRLLDEHVAVHLATNYTDYTQLRVYEVSLVTLQPKKAEYYLGHRRSLAAYSLSLRKTPIHSYLPRTRWTA